MDNEEVKVVSAAENAVPGKEEKAGKCKCANDARTFLIALLTSVIVVLAYHGIVRMMCCPLRHDCRSRVCVMQWKKSGRCDLPEKDFRRFEKHRRCDRDDCSNLRHRHHEKHRQRPIQQKQAE